MTDQSYQKICGVEGCGREHIACGLCHMHRRRLLRTGTTNASLRTMSPEVRFKAKLKQNENTGCLEWQGSINADGYGKFSVNGVIVYAHRFAWELANGPIPDGLFALHECDNPPCCDDTHLFLGTKADNSADMVAKCRQANGERNGRAKLTEMEVLDAKKLISQGLPYHEIAEILGVSQSCISVIAIGRKWKHIT